MGLHNLLPTLSVREAYAGKHVLVTGVTGFLGKVWLAMVLDHVPDVAKLTVLARGKKGQSAHDRFEQIAETSPAFRALRQTHGPAFRKLVAQKVDVVDAQLTQPFCGLGEEAAQKLMADVDIVVHFAGLVDFEPEPSLAIDANIHGARYVADLAAMTESKRYVHVSTCFVAGMRNGEVSEGITLGISPNGTRFDPEAELAELEAELEVRKDARKSERIDYAMDRAKALGWPNIYTYTKSLSEHLIDGRGDLCTTTFRPAIVECAESYPFAGWNEGLNTSGPLIWLLSTGFRRFPARNSAIFDVVPVDTVARSMVLVTAAALRDEAKPFYQCASGDQNPMKFERAIDLTGLAVRKLHKDSDDWWTRNVIAFTDPYAVDPDKEQILGYKRMRQAAKATRKFLRDFKLKKSLSPNLYERWDGAGKDEELRSFSMKCRTTDRKLGQVDDMLKQFRPFVHDHDYTFKTGNLKELTDQLTGDERGLFGFTIEELCWRDYWVNVQVPGLDTWSIPVLRGDKVPDDEPLPREEEQRDTGEFSRKDIDAALKTPAKKPRRRATA